MSATSITSAQDTFDRLVYSGRKVGVTIDYIRLIPGLEMGSRAPYMLAALAWVRSRHDVALHVQEEWLAQALASEQRTETFLVKFHFIIIINPSLL